MGKGRSLEPLKLIDIVIDAIKESQKSLRQSPHKRFAGLSKASIAHPQGVQKVALVDDLTAEHGFRQILNARAKDEFVLIGEESDDGERPMDRVWVIADIVDGTDLYEMEIPLWCSAALLFDPRKPAIIGSVVVLASGEVFFADESEIAKVIRPGSKKTEAATRVRGPSNVKTISDARICFYGQKAKNFIPIVESVGFKNLLSSLATKTPSPDFRMYNFAGNPALVRLADRAKRPDGSMLSAGIDAVFDISTNGQQLHDVAPGAFIAMCAGAVLYDLQGNELDKSQLAKKLLTPKERLRYVLAATPELGKDLCQVLAGDEHGRDRDSRESQATTPHSQRAEHASKAPLISNTEHVRYVAEFPDHLQDIIQMVGKAEKSLDILVDCVDYGSFSDPRHHDQLQWAIEEAVNRNRSKADEFTVNMLVVDGPAPITKASPLYPFDGTKEEFKEVLNRFLLRHARLENYPLAKPEDLLAMLQEQQAKAFERLCDARVKVWQVGKDGVAPMRLEDILVTHASEGRSDSANRSDIFFWIADKKEAVFVLTNVGPKRWQMSFHTSNAQVIGVLNSIVAAYLPQ